MAEQKKEDKQAEFWMQIFVIVLATILLFIGVWLHDRFSGTSIKAERAQAQAQAEAKPGEH